MTLREYISFWQGTYDKHQSRPTTYAAHNYVFKNHILPGLGDVLLSELTSEMVGEFLEERKRFGNHRPGSSGLGEETMRHIHRLLQQCLDQAMRDGLITENPAKSFHYRKSTTVKADIMTPLEMEDYLDAAEQFPWPQRQSGSGRSYRLSDRWFRYPEEDPGASGERTDASGRYFYAIQHLCEHRH